MYKFVIHLKSGKIIEFEHKTESFDELSNWYSKHNDSLAIWSLKDTNTHKSYKIPFVNIEYVVSYYKS